MKRGSVLLFVVTAIAAMACVLFSRINGQLPYKLFNMDMEALRGSIVKKGNDGQEVNVLYLPEVEILSMRNLALAAMSDMTAKATDGITRSSPNRGYYKLYFYFPDIESSIGYSRGTSFGDFQGNELLESGQKNIPISQFEKKLEIINEDQIKHNHGMTCDITITPHDSKIPFNSDFGEEINLIVREVVAEALRFHGFIPQQPQMQGRIDKLCEDITNTLDTNRGRTPSDPFRGQPTSGRAALLEYTKDPAKSKPKGLESIEYVRSYNINVLSRLDSWKEIFDNSRIPGSGSGSTTNLKEAEKFALDELGRLIVISKDAKAVNFFLARKRAQDAIMEVFCKKHSDDIIKVCRKEMESGGPDGLVTATPTERGGVVNHNYPRNRDAIIFAMYTLMSPMSPISFFRHKQPYRVRDMPAEVEFGSARTRTGDKYKEKVFIGYDHDLDGRQALSGRQSSRKGFFSYSKSIEIEIRIRAARSSTGSADGNGSGWTKILSTEKFVCQLPGCKIEPVLKLGRVNAI
ncbi:MAG: hypothetical protein LBR91_01605 [Puniceicoccales bacterium]|jgi:hypothetical protein|nr:hypothetical protein [Puniceicoccales bacterium]